MCLAIAREHPDPDDLGVLAVVLRKLAGADADDRVVAQASRAARPSVTRLWIAPSAWSMPVSPTDSDTRDKLRQPLRVHGHRGEDDRGAEDDREEVLPFQVAHQEHDPEEQDEPDRRASRERQGDADRCDARRPERQEPCGGASARRWQGTGPSGTSMSMICA